ncbi:hypothetical protein D3C73_758630 [compost metagenome]
MADHVTHAAGHQHLLEATTGTDDQDDRGGRREAGIEPLHHLAGTDALLVAEGIQRQQQGQQQRRDRVTDQVHEGAEDVAIGQHHVGKGLEQHQEHRQQHGHQRDAEARQFSRIRFARQLIHQLLVRMTGNVLGNERTEDRASDDGGWQRNDQAVQNGLADVGTEHADGQQRTRVRRHQAVYRGQTGQQRDTDLDDRHASATGHDEHQRNQQHEADFEEQRNADQERGEHHRPLHLVLAEGADQRLRNLIRTA